MVDKAPKKEPQILRPVLRWAGGKSGMVEKLLQLLPSGFKNYLEPMSGGAALFFVARPATAVLSDVNADLINFYSILRERPNDLIRRLLSLKASKEQYYAFRASSPRSLIGRAVRFAYLNRLAWNGLYRENRQGQFNVPIGNRLPEVMWDEKDLLSASAALASARLLTADFRQSAQHAEGGDFVFFDPPYPRGARDRLGFNRYSRQFFGEQDHWDLARLIEELDHRCVRVMATLADADHLDRLYPRNLRRTRVASKALIACNGSDRREVAELILTNY